MSSADNEAGLAATSVATGGDAKATSPAGAGASTVPVGANESLTGAEVPYPLPPADTNPAPDA
ncbi:MAG TPA: hypothetical protein VGL92_13365, partial [Acidimicrobiia bacterium]